MGRQSASFEMNGDPPPITSNEKNLSANKSKLTEKLSGSVIEQKNF